VLCDDLVSLGGRYSRYECCGRVCSWVRWCGVHPCGVGDNDPVLGFGDDDGEMAVSLSLFEVRALEDRERSSEFVLEFVNRFGSYNPRDLRDGIFLRCQHLVRPALGRLARHRSDFACGKGGRLQCYASRWAMALEEIGNQLLNLCLTLKSMIRLITIYEDCLLV